jgi:acyl-CoA reductase-like NAD-dependent aldehyde dehydrogenase
MPLNKKKEAALKFADLLEENAERLGKVMTSETGKPITQVRLLSDFKQFFKKTEARTYFHLMTPTARAVRS